MSQTTHAADTHAAPKAKSAADKAKDTQKLLAYLVTDWLHGDRHHQDQIMELALEMLDDMGEEGAEAKERLTAMAAPAKAA